MIFKATMSQAYEAAGYELSDAQLDERYETMMSQWEDLYQENFDRLIRQWTEKTGQSMIDGMTRGHLMTLSQQMATDEIQELWLDPLTQDVIQSQLDEEEPSSLKVLNSTDLWMTQWHLLPEDGPTFKLACELWPDKPTKWLSIASALMQVCDYQGKLYPHSLESKLLPEFEKKIDHAVTLQYPTGTVA